MKKIYLIFLSLTLIGCTSPYSAAGIPEIPGIQVGMRGAEEAELILSNELPNDCDYLRDAILLKSAAVALGQNFDHFEFTDYETSKLEFLQNKRVVKSVITVHLCRGTCPQMYSAQSISHMLVGKFSQPTWKSAAQKNSSGKICTIE